MFSVVNMDRLLWLLASFVITNANQQCRQAYSSTGSYLKGHVISSGTTANIGECLVKCSGEPRCRSINFRFEDLFCELNDADRYTHPWDYGPKQGHAYNDYPNRSPQVTENMLLSQSFTINWPVPICIA